jgi:signal transduction histidine kinase
MVGGRDGADPARPRGAARGALAALLDRARRDEAGRAVARERLRIARELHDVVGHSMSVVAVQSGMAEHVLATQPERAAAALAAIAESSRSALTELRRLLGVLRSDDEPEGSLAPALGVGDLPALVERLRDARVGAHLTTAGDGAAVPTAVGLTAYRVVQEALTNVVRRAGGRHGGAGDRAPQTRHSRRRGGR